MTYHPVHETVWSDPRVKNLSDGAFRAYMLMTTHPKVSSVGVIIGGPGWISDTLGVDHRKAKRIFQEVVDAGLVVFYPENREVWSPEFVLKRYIKNPNSLHMLTTTALNLASYELSRQILYQIESRARALNCRPEGVKGDYLASYSAAYNEPQFQSFREWLGNDSTHSTALHNSTQLTTTHHPSGGKEEEGGGEDIPSGYKSKSTANAATDTDTHFVGDLYPPQLPPQGNAPASKTKTPADQTKTPTPLPTQSIPPKPSKDIPASADQVQTPTQSIPPNQTKTPTPDLTSPLSVEETNTLRRLDSANTSANAPHCLTGSIMQPDGTPAYPGKIVRALRLALASHPATLINIRAAADDIMSGIHAPATLTEILAEIAPADQDQVQTPDPTPTPAPAPRKTKANSRRSDQGNSGRTPTPAPPTAQDSSDASQSLELAGLWSQLTRTHGCPKNKYSRTRDLQALAQALADGVTPDQVLIRWSARVGEWAGRCADAKYLPTLSAWITDKGGHLIALDEESAAPHRDTPTPAAPLTPDQEAAAAKAMAGLTFTFPTQPQETPQ